MRMVGACDHRVGEKRALCAKYGRCVAMPVKKAKTSFERQGYPDVLLAASGRGLLALYGVMRDSSVVIGSVLSDFALFRSI